MCNCAFTVNLSIKKEFITEFLSCMNTLVARTKVVYGAIFVANRLIIHIHKCNIIAHGARDLFLMAAMFHNGAGVCDGVFTESVTRAIDR